MATTLDANLGALVVAEINQDLTTTAEITEITGDAGAPTVAGFARIVLKRAMLVRIKSTFLSINIYTTVHHMIEVNECINASKNL